VIFHLIAVPFMLVGLLFFFGCVVGLIRFPDFYTRMHAASVIETPGAGLILLGLLFQAGFTQVAAKLVVIGLLIFFASPTATHALARAALERGLRPQLSDEKSRSSKP